MCRYALALLLVPLAMLSRAQDIDDHAYKLGVNVELVQLPVSVLDGKGFPVRGLQQEHFAVYEDKVQQNITLFKQEDIPLSVGLVIDASGSMIDKRDRLNVAAMTFVRESNPQDETAVVSFGDEVNLEQDFTTSTRDLSAALSQIPSTGNTSLYDAVILAASHLKKEGFHDKKVLLVVSDGEDNHSSYNLKQVLTAIQESKLILYTVGLLSRDGTALGDEGRRALKQLAEAGGGASFFPKNINDVTEVCRRIARDLRNQYTVGYRPSNEKLDGAWRKVVVQVNPPKSMPKVKVRTKQGYYAPVSREIREASNSVK